MSCFGGNFMEMLEEKLEKLKKRTVQFASLVQAMIENSIKGLLEKDREMLKDVIDNLEDQANLSELEIDELCLSSIALYQPEAKNLRITMMISKINNDLERMADLAVNIADSGLYLIDRPEIKPLVDIPRMAQETVKMLKNAMNAFVDENALLAVDVLKNDDIVDNLRNAVLRELISHMSSDSSVLERGLNLIRIARNLERIADLTTNIAEDVIFIKEGKVVKHHMNY
jgi:phosphate transport system protein